MSGMPVQFSAQTSAATQAVWALEHQYWQYVERNDLEGYRSLWDEKFLGWPQADRAPVHKDHITDWITSQTSKGLTFKLVELKEAAIQENGDLVATGYWLTSRWDSKTSVGEPGTIRVHHTWARRGNGWKIVSGMSALATQE
jgi:hypothetical protein